MRLLTIHHPDAVNDPYELDHSPEGPGSLREAVSAEFDVLVDDAAGDLDDGRWSDEYRRSEQSRAIKSLTRRGEYTDALGVRWTLTNEEANR